MITVASCKAIQIPIQLNGVVVKNVLSVWGPTSPPIFGFLKIYIL